jgi:hypothetical protein
VRLVALRLRRAATNHGAGERTQGVHIYALERRQHGGKSFRRPLRRTQQRACRGEADLYSALVVTGQNEQP